MKTPDQLYPELFEAIQLSQIFPDSKTFVDMIPKVTPSNILEAYHLNKGNTEFDLLTFVEDYFSYPDQGSKDFNSDMNKTTSEHITHLWDHLSRQSDQVIAGSSLLPLPNKYIVPGGRFREIYYWDSYFTMLGLKVDGRVDLIEAMVDNFAYLIMQYGHIPNGNRSYYLSRSQPPFFSHMVSLLAEEKGNHVYEKNLNALIKEYNYWTQNANRQKNIQGHTLNIYYDALDIPRQESYVEDEELSGGDPTINRHIRSGAESGWDFSSRWQKDPMDLHTIETSDIVPIDLNCLLYHLELTIAKTYHYLGDIGNEGTYTQFAQNRKKAIQETLLSEQGVYTDYLLNENCTSDRWSLAMLYPLFIGMASQDIADQTAAIIQSKFLKEGGLITTLQHSGQQWDAPNGWSPLQWIAFAGLQKYGHHKLAYEIADRWTRLIENVYQRTGKLMEKYNVEDLSLDAGGGEYPVQDGFGWTNGVYLAMKKYLNQ